MVSYPKYISDIYENEKKRRKVVFYILTNRTNRKGKL